MVSTNGGAAAIIFDRRAFLWTAGGYQPLSGDAGIERLLTPPSTVAVLRMGYRPVCHPSLQAFMN